jgi:divalent metal cation (Fe/Co/Zn/Cd) transporter
MNSHSAFQQADTKRLYAIAFGLAIFTILYNIAEGLVSTYFGYQDKSLALLGFGCDSFIEVLSGLGIAHLVLRVWRQPDSHRDNFERTALTITGYAFYILTVGLIATSTYNLWTGRQPETTLWGIIISLISLAIMWVLMYNKRKIGNQLHSDAILADAECTKVCMYMSAVLLVSSGIYEITSFSFTDTIGSFGLAYLSYREGHECFEKVKKNSLCLCKNIS